MTTLFLAGAEQASHRNLLIECGVERFALNITNLNRLIKNSSWSVEEHLPPGSQWALYADEKSTWEMAAPYVEQEPDLILGPLDWAAHFANSDTYAPFWEPSVEPGVHALLGLTDDVVKNQGKLRRILADYPQSMLIAVTGSSKGVDRLDALISSAWIATQRYGETQVWSGTKLHRYAGARKAEVRPKHRADIERLGIDYEAIIADDPQEVCRLGVVSWLAWEERHDSGEDVDRKLVLVPSNLTYVDQDGSGSTHRPLGSQNGAARHGHPVNGNGNLVVTPRERVLLPVLGLDTLESTSTDGDGNETVTETTAVRSVGVSMRQCDSCFLASRCPKYQPHEACAFEIPVEIKSKDQLQGLMRTVIEIQGQRVMFARFAEEIDGQGLDGTLSAEIDRLFKAIAAAKDINDTRDVLRLEMEAKGNAGMLSRLFGSSVGEQARALSVPVSSTEVMHGLDPER